MSYVLVGHPVYGSDPPGPPVVLAVSSDKAKLEAYGKTLQVAKQWPPRYVYEGRTYEHVVVEGPVVDLDGPRVVVAGTIGTFNM